MASLINTICKKIKETNLDISIIEKELGFKEDSIKNYINSDWINLDKTFSPLKLCKYLSIPIEDYHSGYFIGFNKEKYLKYMKEYREFTF